MQYIICLGWDQTRNDPPVNLGGISTDLKFNGSTTTSIPRSVVAPAAILYPFPDLVVDKSQLKHGVRFIIHSIMSFSSENETVNLYSSAAIRKSYNNL